MAGLLFPAGVLAQEHGTGFYLLKQCPITAVDGQTVACSATIRNSDDQHGVINVNVVNTILAPINGSTTAVLCFDPLTCGASTCTPDTNSPKPLLTSLTSTDGSLSTGPGDTMVCTFNETVNVGTCVQFVPGVCNLGTGLCTSGNTGASCTTNAECNIDNRLRDRVNVTGTDDTTADNAAAQGETSITVACCGDGIANQPGVCDLNTGFCTSGKTGAACTTDAECYVETCDTNPIGTVPDNTPFMDCAPFCAPGVQNMCRTPGSLNECTLCGDGLVQASSNEACDDGNTNNNDGCTNSCETTTTSSSTSTSSTSSTSTSSTSSTSTTSTSSTSTSSTSSTSTSSTSSTSTSSTTTTSTSSTSTTLLLQLNHFQCYEIRPPQTFSRTGLALADQFGSQTVDLRKATAVCAPADKQGEDPTAPDDAAHLTSYVLSAPRFSRLHDQRVVNQFGELLLDVVKPARLLVPSSKSVSGGPLPPLGGVLDHFTCYKVKRSRGAARFAKQIGVEITTQFETTTIDVVKPLRLCAPTNKNGESPGAEDHDEHLLCYRVRSGSGVPTTGVDVNNQFGPQHYSLSQRREFCVPSLKNPPPYGSPSRAFVGPVPDLLS